MNKGGFDLSSIPPDALSNAIAQLSAHPELISAVASALGTSAPQSEPKPEETVEETPVSASSSSELDLGTLIGSLAPVMAALGGKKKKDPREEHRDALLCALKPYLNEERRRVLEHMLKIGQLGDIFKMLK